MNEAPQNSDNPGVIARPPFIFLGFLAFAFILDWVWPLGAYGVEVPALGRWIAGPVLMGLGGALLGTCVAQFNRAETSFHPNDPDTAIVTTGPYRFSRNPIYVAVSLIYLGLAAALGIGWAVPVLVVVLVVIRYGVIAREEAYLERTFGDEYLRYKAAVRRWF